MKVSFDILCLDERDSPNLSELKHKTRKEIKSLKNRRYFGLCGVLIPGADYPEMKIAGRRIQEKCHGVNTFKPFHYTEILNNSGDYAHLGINAGKRKGLITRLNNFLDHYNFKIISAFIDKQKLALDYGLFPSGKLLQIHKIKPGISNINSVKNINLYVICLKFILKDYYEYLVSKRKRGLIIAEARGEKEDRALLEAFYYFQRLGINSIKGKDLRSYIIDLLIVHKKQNHIGIQIADLVTYPLYDYFVPDHNIRNDHFIKKDIIGKKKRWITIFPK